MAITIFATPGKAINLGRAGENLATTVKFYVKDWMDEFGVVEPEQEVEENNTTQYQGLFTLFVQQNGIGYYVQSLVEDEAENLEGDYVEWNVTSANTATVGMGKCELQYIVNEIIVKSIIYDIIVTTSLDVEAQGDIPDPIESWLNEVSQMTQQIANASEYADLAERYAKGTSNEAAVQEGTAGYHDNSKYYKELAESAKNTAVAAAEEAEAYDTRVKNMTASATTGEPGTEAAVAVTKTTTAWQLQFTIPRGSGYKLEQSVSTYSDLAGISDPVLYGFYGVNDTHHIYVYTGSGVYSDYGTLGGVVAQLNTWTAS